ncbi:hypothetical protein GCWU000341_00742 [Oribacterium sp. oral taxon 078 str. F0262]|nr:hypothetical protein GCWU000341_00742 [Oribacterium sp. oral taxon 078 str. F0262]
MLPPIPRHPLSTLSKSKSAARSSSFKEKPPASFPLIFCIIAYFRPNFYASFPVFCGTLP